MIRALLLFILSVFCIGCTSNSKTNKITTDIIHANSKNIEFIYDGQVYPFEAKDEDINFGYNPDPHTVEIKTDLDLISFEMTAGMQKPVQLILSKKDTIRLVLISPERPSNFTTSYKEQHRGKYSVLCREVHELVNIAVALTTIGKEDTNMVEQSSDYYKQVLAHFDQFKEHALIQELEQHITEVFGSETYGYYYNIRMNANMYAFSTTNTIINDSPFTRMGFGSENLMEPLLGMLEDFAQKSNFREFYAQQSEYYNQLITDSEDLMPIRKMWDWVEAKFPQRYDSYVIYISPLVNGAHSTQKFIEDDFKQTAMFINAPFGLDDLSDQEREAAFTRIVFTEIDHNYVNPTTDAYPEVAEAITDLSCWNTGGQGYGNNYATVNEYLTWAVYSMYLYDNFEPEVFEKSNDREANFMNEGRGFIQYKAFNDFAVDWYKNHPNTSITSFFPEAAKWIENQPCVEALSKVSK
jgi:hypothetical protein